MVGTWKTYIGGEMDAEGYIWKRKRRLVCQITGVFQWESVERRKGEPASEKKESWSGLLKSIPVENYFDHLKRDS